LQLFTSCFRKLKSSLEVPAKIAAVVCRARAVPGNPGKGRTTMGFTEDLDGLASLDESKDADEINLLGRDHLRSDRDVEAMPEDMSRRIHQKDNDKMLLLAVTLAVIGPLMFGFTLGCVRRILFCHRKLRDFHHVLIDCTCM
jgi:hypothetical protein